MSAPHDPVAERWGFYRDTLVVIDVPGFERPVNGPDGLDPWPFGEIIHVLTAWAPRGAERTDAVNIAANADLAAQIIRSGGGIVPAKGIARSTAYVGEPGWLAWGLTRERALELGQQFVQDAIYEMDASNIRILDCSGDAVSGQGPDRYDEYSRFL
ncbi:MAG: DUF3293 domain-containing protein [Acidimicrobiia bacterium]